MQRFALATVILGALALTAGAQQPIRVSGRVVADDTGKPNPQRAAAAPARVSRPA